MFIKNDSKRGQKYFNGSWNCQKNQGRKITEYRPEHGINAGKGKVEHIRYWSIGIKKVKRRSC